MKTARVKLTSEQLKTVLMNDRRAIVLAVDAHVVGAVLELHAGTGRIYRVVSDIDPLATDLTQAVYSIRPLNKDEKISRQQEQEEDK